MKILLLNKNDQIYSSNSYLVLGCWNRLEDVNTLIDVGADASILKELEDAHTGVGKKKVDQVILTHNHFDHTGNLETIKKRYNPKVYAFGKEDFVDRSIEDGQTIRIGNNNFEVIHTPGHSSDSICLYCDKEGVLFSGDTPLRIMSANGNYSYEFIESLKKIARKKIKVIYSGHDWPIHEKVQEMIGTSLKNAQSGLKIC